MSELKIGTKEYMNFYKEKFIKLFDGVQREGKEKLLKHLEESSFYRDPASQYYHANHPGGLCFHSYNLIRIAIALNKLYKTGVPEESIIIAGACHDLCKISNYKLDTKWQKDKNNKWESYLTYGNNELSQVQHGPQSALIASKFIVLTDAEEQAICWHMSSYGQSDADNRAMNKCMKTNPLVLILQQSDMASAYFFEECYDKDKIPGLTF